MSVEPQTVVHDLLPRLQGLADSDYAKQLPRTMPGLVNFTGVRVPDLRDLAKDIAREHSMQIPDWVAFLAQVIPGRHRELILIGAFGLDGRTDDLDDLFGERMSNWARHLDNWETTDQLAPAAGNWVRGDISRLGYLESWAVRGESIWKKRLAAVATIQFRHDGPEMTHKALRVLRHLMEAREPELRKAVAWALRKQQDEDAVERFLAWWAPRVKPSLIRDSSQKLSEERKKRILALVE